MNLPKAEEKKETSLPKRGDCLDNLERYPTEFKLPLLESVLGNM
jgi:hypothetical protein